MPVQPPISLPSPTMGVSDALIEELFSNDVEVRKVANAELDTIARIGFGPEDSQKLLLAALRPNQVGTRVHLQPYVYIFSALKRQPSERFIPVIEAQFPRKDANQARYAFALLGAIGTKAAAEAVLNILREQRPRLPASLILQEFAESPDPSEVSSVLFPSLLEFVDSDPPQFSICRLLWIFHDAGWLSEETVAPATTSTLALYAKLEKRLSRQQQTTTGRWMYSDSYSVDRDYGGLWLDLLPAFPTTQSRNFLRRATKFTDPLLQYYAVRSFLRLGEKVDPAVLLSVAAHPETRNRLYGLLAEKEMLSEFPKPYWTQAALSEADMFEWLVYPTELGEPPGKLELMAIVPTPEKSRRNREDYYVYRFTDRKKPREWLAGIVGPIPRDGELHYSVEDTYSDFEPWDKCSPEEHVARMLKDGEKD
ncbi:MAG: hypothetical protein K1X53_06975 [Candidatus Sumerlaeaceae bacterium]|nr:hypothetical protein [Candidatus Sumerlaeaceae bacterium]